MNRDPRVLQVVLSLNPGGTERVVVELAYRLHAIVPAVCCLDEEGAWAGVLTRLGVEVTALGRKDGFRPSLGRAIAHIARNHDATVLHCHQYSPFVYGSIARLWRPRCRVVFTEHGRLSDAPPSPKRRRANRVLSRLPSAVFAVSDNVRQHLVGEGFPPGAVKVIYNGIDPGSLPDPAARSRVREVLHASSETLVVGTIARLDPVKDLSTLIRATAEASRLVPVKCVLVGDGPERISLERLTSGLGLEDRIVFVGHRDDARDWLAGCDVYVNSSISEGVSLTILEAMAAGLPVVATRVGGTPEILDGSCGCLVPARDSGAIAGALFHLQGRPELRAELGSAARRRVVERFSMDRMVREYMDVYRSLA